MSKRTKKVGISGKVRKLPDQKKKEKKLLTALPITLTFAFTNARSRSTAQGTFARFPLFAAFHVLLDDASEILLVKALLLQSASGLPIGSTFCRRGILSSRLVHNQTLFGTGIENAGWAGKQRYCTSVPTGVLLEKPTSMCLCVEDVTFSRILRRRRQLTTTYSGNYICWDGERY